VGKTLIIFYHPQREDSFYECCCSDIALLQQRDEDRTIEMLNNDKMEIKLCAFFQVRFPYLLHTQVGSDEEQNRYCITPISSSHHTSIRYLLLVLVRSYQTHIRKSHSIIRRWEFICYVFTLTTPSSSGLWMFLLQLIV
jgi:hypothetical protein